jgi:undecaprenyl phosphate-alpha-L-ara4FN deformylase
MTQPVIALKVDVDTWTGTRDGVPRLLEILERFGIRGTFYFSMGPDNSGKAIRRIFTRKGFLKKMLRTRAPSMYGIRTLLSGTLLPAPVIGASFPDILARTEQMGHETGIHCWDHVEWHDHLPLMGKETVSAELKRACRLFEEIFGHRAASTAAPGWTMSPVSLEVQDGLSLSYCSDARGNFPFFPVVEGRRFTTLQIPTTWPTMDEILGENGITAENINNHYLSLLRPGLNVHTIHAELEGNAMDSLFIDLLERLQQRDVSFVTLAEAAAGFSSSAPHHLMSMGEIAGRAGMVAVQGERV